MRCARFVGWMFVAGTGASLAGCGRIGYDLDGLADRLDVLDGGTPGDASGAIQGADGASGTDGSTIVITDDSGALGDGSTGATDGGGTFSDGSTGATDGGGTASDGSTGATDGGGMVDAACAGSCTCTTFGGHQYQFCGTAVAGTVAQSNCVSAGMRLARVDDRTENDWIRNTANSQGITVEIYIGAEDPTATSHWQWQDGTVFWIGPDTGGAQGGLFANWMTSKPTGTPVRTCGLMAADGTWYDSGCGLVRPYVCEAY